MDDIVRQAMAKWPNVPACYGWLALDARGNWYMRDDRAQAAGAFASGAVGAKGSLLRHDKLIEFIGRNYLVDETGCWYFQNGPQRVFVELEAAPWVWRLQPDGSVRAHTGTLAQEVRACVLDEEGHVYLDTDLGFGLVHTQDVALAAEAIEAGRWQVEEARRANLAGRFGYVLSPERDSLGGGGAQIIPRHAHRWRHRRQNMSVKELFKLDGRIALITGGSRGLGLQMAEALGEMGCRLAITARKADELAEAKAHLERQGIEVLTVVNDLQQHEQIPGLVDQVLARYGQIDILVNNAGATWGAPAEDYPDAAWHKVMNLNVNAPFFLSREVGKRSMIPRQQGKIINIASVAGLKGTAAGVHTIAYNTSKAAAINFTRTLAAEWGRYNINVNAICPGFFPSRMSAGLLEKVQDAVIARAPLHRIGGEEDLKGSVVFLASEASRHITGQYLAVDGGTCIV